MAFERTGIQECLEVLFTFKQQITNFDSTGWTDDFIIKISTMPLMKPSRSVLF